MLSERRQIGIGLTSAGAAFLALGVFLLCDPPLLALGNIMLIAGILTTMGVRRTGRYFWRRPRGTVCFAGGIGVVLCGWPVIGIALELFGIVNLFGNMFPAMWAVFRTLPGVNQLFH
ncbi:Vesicle transport protein [Plasmodiophora brassicae]|uniref:Vesicle transport protein n=1 Tax=Plasmodiophora brassicae TaxID=37360 RepID=A0A0G4IYQ3_PLABS|nr:hypothetical protein PBRA_001446 [Plasmodiophora brassicae]SPQ94098.1 unnamed protein product [Plasmodiophora brassicae]